MSFRRLHKWVTYVVSGLGLLALTLGGELSTGVRVLIGIAFVASWFAEPPRIARPGWARGWTTLVVTTLGVQVVRAAGGEPPFGLAVEFAALLTLSRLFNRRTGADFQQIAVLAFLHLIAGTVLTTGLSYGVLFVAFVIVTPWMLAMTHMRVEIEGNYPVGDAGERSVRVERVLASRRIVGPSFLGWTAALSLPLFLSTIAMFVLFPRVGFGFVSMANRRGEAVAGFGDDIELGGFGVIRTDTTVVMRLTPEREPPPDVLQRMLRLRGTSFDHYDGRRWTRSQGPRAKVSSVGEYYPIHRAPRRDDIRVKVVLESLQDPVVFLPRGTVGLRIPSVGTAGSRRRRRLTRGYGYDVRYDARDDVGLVYEAYLSRDPEYLSLPIDETDVLVRYLQLPDRHGALIRYARELTRDDPSPSAKVETLLHFVRDSGRFTYSLEQGHAGGRPPLMAFVFGHKQGHCEYFATALAILLRSVGVPTRNVTGFLGAEYNAYGGYFAVEQGKAHSWVEALLPERGWVTLDPTPPARNRASATRSLLTSVREMVDALRTYWLTEVIGYDLRAQLRGLRRAGAFFRELGWGGGSSLDAEQRSKASGEPERRYALWVMGLLALGGLLWLGGRLWRRTEGGAREGELPSADAQRARKLYRRLESVLARHGLHRAASTTPLHYLEELEATGYVGLATVRRITEHYVAARYGGARLGAQEARELEREIAGLRRSGR